ncbi:MAG: hypothetical protein JWP65_1503 [Ramlibacter sp.]|uniref:phospholipase effector Tle1 domain-containing protein n=1 Tax=Ramlibacter sp. TaxID=1917967 RepID=UPI0026084200|nr:DUF2235 domain-containing protein [Ramlibacter sp.]MDB5751082.1 hypothetical protein [Ramlibacter sp.]
MPKNIIIFSDGTGQQGGLKPDQNLSNIYKLFRAARTGPDSPVDPKHQIAYYDAGLGTEPDQGSIPLRTVQAFRRMWSGATGTGISRNIADCYQAILKHYEPGDRVFLFGFSRGAYTARCVGGVMSLCGVPTHDADGGPLPRYGNALRKISDEAVQQVYEHGSGSHNPEHKLQRQEKGRRFRAKYGSNNTEGLANEVPYFIGVFDTVAALGAPGIRRLLMALVLVTFVAGLTALVAGVLALSPWVAFWPAYAALGALIGLSMGVSYVRSNLKTICDYPTEGKSDWHFAPPRFQIYDESLNTRVRYARHALAIDESRKDFDRVVWAIPGERPDRTGEPEWLQQLWFAGNHSNIGGSYAEDESRLSDISLQWMLEQATTLPHPLQVDRSKLSLFPDPAGMQHDEIESMRDSYPWWVPKAWRHTWVEKPRKVPAGAILHPTVAERVALSGGVLRYGRRTAYRPTNLSSHGQVAQFYGPDTQHVATNERGDSQRPPGTV